MGKDAPAPQWQSYEEALFQIGKLNHIEIDIPKDVWKKLLQNPEKKEYCRCSVTINGTIPSTWDAQELEHQKLIDCTDIDLSKMGNCGDFE